MYADIVKLYNVRSKRTLSEVEVSAANLRALHRHELDVTASAAGRRSDGAAARALAADSASVPNQTLTAGKSTFTS